MVEFKCEHNWEVIESDDEHSTHHCMNCHAYRLVDHVHNTETINIALADGQVLINDVLHCGTCGMLAQTGDEEYDWCDHRTGAGCAYNLDDDDDDDDDMHLGDWNEDEIVEDLVRTGDPDFEDDFIGEDHESEIDTEYIGDDFDDDDPETD